MRLIKSDMMLKFKLGVHMNCLKNKILFSSLLLLSIVSCSPYQKIEVAKSASNIGGPQTLIYSLPKTRVDIEIAITKITTKAGPYAAYAEKYLTLSGATLSNS